MNELRPKYKEEFLNQHQESLQKWEDDRADKFQEIEDIAAQIKSIKTANLISPFDYFVKDIKHEVKRINPSLNHYERKRHMKILWDELSDSMKQFYVQKTHQKAFKREVNP